MRKILAAIAVTTVILISSCQKEFSSENGIVTTTTNDDSTTLVQYIDLDTTATAGLDTIVKMTFTYDNLKRLTESNYLEYGSGVADKLFKCVMLYNGADTMPYKKVETESDQLGGNIVYVETGYYGYSNGKIVLDSVMYNTGQIPEANRYVHLSDRITITTYAYINPVPDTRMHTVYFTKTNGNITHQKDTIAGLIVNDFKFLYDNKNNPFYGMPQSFVDRSGPYYHMETYSDEMTYEKNNPVEINEFEDNYHFHFKYVYEYRSNGYPSIARVYDQSDPSNFFKRIFIYTKL